MLSVANSCVRIIAISQAVNIVSYYVSPSLIVPIYILTFVAQAVQVFHMQWDLPSYLTLYDAYDSPN